LQVVTLLTLYQKTWRHNAKSHILRWPPSPTIHFCGFLLKAAITILFRPLQT
jgi:hypothetical protein